MQHVSTYHVVGEHLVGCWLSACMDKVCMEGWFVVAEHAQGLLLGHQLFPTVGYANLVFCLQEDRPIVLRQKERG